MSIYSELDNLKNKVLARAGQIVRRGIIKIVSSDYFAQIEGMDDERFEDVELFQQFGFCSRPPADSEAIIIHPDSADGDPIAIATSNNAYRPQGLDEGEVVIYAGDELSNTKLNDRAMLRLKADGTVELICDGADWVHLGGDESDADERILKGEEFNTDFNTYLVIITTQMAAITAACGTVAGGGMAGETSWNATARAYAEAIGVASGAVGAAATALKNDLPGNLSSYVKTR